MAIDQINLWAVALAGGARFILSLLWYSPFLFAKVWFREVGDAQEGLLTARGPLALSAGLGFLAAFTLAVIIALADLNFVKSLALGGLIGVGLMTAMSAGQYAFEGRSFRLFAFTAGQNIIELILMAAIIGGLRV